MIRELYRRPDGGVIMKAVNPNYDDVIIKNNELENLTVLGWLYSHNNIDVWPDRKLNS
jgi:phage repressor protein C with HTH and peptisase S24 domain